MKGKVAVGSAIGKIAGGAAKGADVISTGKSVAVITFSVMMVLFANILFQLNIQINAEAKKGLDPALPYMHAIAMHEVKGHPFMHYLSQAVERNSELVDDDVNITEELMRFQEFFTLYNSTGGVVLDTEESFLRSAEAEGGEEGGETTETSEFLSQLASKYSIEYYAVPPGGKLKMKYRWVE